MIYLIIFLGLILRIISLNQSFWLDEATSASVVKNFNFSQIITNFSVGDFHPPFYYLFLKAWTIPFGVSEISVRLLSIIFALLTIYLVYLITKEIFEKSTAVISSLLLATAPLHIYYSQEARMYSMQTFFVSLAVYGYLKIINKAKLVWWIVFSTSLALIAATDYLPLLIVPVFWIYGLLQKKGISWWSKFVLSHLPLASFFALWSPIFGRQLMAGVGVQSTNPAWWQTLGKSGFKELVLLPTKFVLGRISFENKFIYGFLVLLVGGLFAYLLAKAAKEVLSKEKHKQTLLLWLWLVVPIAAAFLLGFKLSVFSYFRLLFVLPTFYILAAYGLSKVKENVFPFAFMAVVIFNIAFSWTYLSNEKFHREDWRGMVNTINEECKEKSCAVVFPADSQQEVYRYYTGDKNLVKSEDLEKGKDIVWLVRYVQNISDPEDSTRKTIENLDYKMVEEKTFNGVVVWKYTNENRN